MKDELWVEHIGSASCTDCFFYEPHHANEEREMGACHRFPPTRAFLHDVGTGDFAAVASSDWCGEFSLKPELKRAFEAEILAKLSGPIP